MPRPSANVADEPAFSRAASINCEIFIQIPCVYQNWLLFFVYQFWLRPEMVDWRSLTGCQER
ncbi:hypothetical protein DP42_4989 [Burkholderia pseudomallei]|nr:hypothetical protein DP42_4989 [Burkholderia pseudomallei]